MNLQIFCGQNNDCCQEEGIHFSITGCTDVLLSHMLVVVVVVDNVIIIIIIITTTTITITINDVFYLYRLLVIKLLGPNQGP